MRALQFVKDFSLTSPCSWCYSYSFKGTTLKVPFPRTSSSKTQVSFLWLALKCTLTIYPFPENVRCGPSAHMSTTGNSAACSGVPGLSVPKDDVGVTSWNTSSRLLKSFFETDFCLAIWSKPSWGTRNSQWIPEWRKADEINPFLWPCCSSVQSLRQK